MRASLLRYAWSLLIPTAVRHAQARVPAANVVRRRRSPPMPAGEMDRLRQQLAGRRFARAVLLAPPRRRLAGVGRRVPPAQGCSVPARTDPAAAAFESPALTLAMRAVSTCHTLVYVAFCCCCRSRCGSSPRSACCSAWPRAAAPPRGEERHRPAEAERCLRRPAAAGACDARGSGRARHAGVLGAAGPRRPVGDEACSRRQLRLPQRARERSHRVRAGARPLLWAAPLPGVRGRLADRHGALAHLPRAPLPRRRAGASRSAGPPRCSPGCGCAGSTAAATAPVGGAGAQR